MDKIQISRIDESGFYLEPVLVTQQEINRHLDIEDEFTLGNVVLELVPEDSGHHRSQWNGTEWVEGKPSTELLTLAKQEKINEIKRLAGSKINNVAPVWKQINTLRGTGKTDPIFTEIDNIRTKSDELEVQVNNATTVAEVEAVVWV